LQRRNQIEEEVYPNGEPFHTAAVMEDYARGSVNQAKTPPQEMIFLVEASNYCHTENWSFSYPKIQACSLAMVM